MSPKNPYWPTRKPQDDEVLFSGVDGTGVRAEWKNKQFRYFGTGNTRGEALDALIKDIEMRRMLITIHIKSEA